MIYVKTIVVNVFIVAVILLVVMAASALDSPLGLQRLTSSAMPAIGWALVAVGLFFRFWASYTFYQHRIAILRPNAQHQLVEVGPYQWTRNPLYVGIVLITFGCALIFGSISGLVLAVANFIAWDLWIRFYEEKNLQQAFGGEYREYMKNRPRWLVF